MAQCFEPASLHSRLKLFVNKQRWIVGYSGGVDSTVLLYSLLQLAQSESLPPILALHVNHHIHPDSAIWAKQCEEFCANLKIECQIHDVIVDQSHPKGLEAAAREARYQVYTQVITSDDLLLLGHHLDDQAETLLIQTFRGGGVHGLAAMSSLREIGAGQMLRPLLETTRSMIESYAKRAGLTWIEDPSNQSHQHERNFIRHKIMPMLLQRRAGVNRVLARSAEHFAEAAQLLDELAEHDLEQASEGGLTVINLDSIQQHKPSRQDNLLRYWVYRCSGNYPSSQQLKALKNDVIAAKVDAQPQLQFGDYQVRRFHNHLYWLPQLPQPPVSYPIGIDKPVIELPQGCGTLELKTEIGNGLSLKHLKQASTIEVIWRKGGESLLLKDGHHHRLKKLYQQQNSPPWERDLRPMIAINGEIVQIASLWSHANYEAKADEPGLQFYWSYSGEIALTEY